MEMSLWFNLPVNSIAKSKAFFTQLGFSFNDGPGNTDSSACLQFNEKSSVVMLFETTKFEEFVSHPVTDAQLSSEVLISIGVSSSKAVDDLLEKVKIAGGIVFSPAQAKNEHMYGGGFSDLDGHRWNILYMNF